MNNDFEYALENWAKSVMLEELWESEQGFGTLEMVLIIVVLVGLVVVFKDNITALVDNIFNKINTDVSGFYS